MWELNLEGRGGPCFRSPEEVHFRIKKGGDLVQYEIRITGRTDRKNQGSRKRKGENGIVSSRKSANPGSNLRMDE